MSVFSDDDPCWGRPDRCSLADLLLTLGVDRQTNNSKIVLQETEKYILLSKPPDLRMDGPYQATVHKLLTLLYPPPSLRRQLDIPGDDASTTTRDCIKNDTQQRLLERVMTLHKFNDLDDNELRPCHQLDYATSGCLLVARSSAAAKIAGDALSARHAGVQKKYLALVYGHVSVREGGDLQNDDVDQQWPVLSQSDFQHRFHTMEHEYRRTRSKRRKDTFIGFLPSHAVFERWKSSHNSSKTHEANARDKKKRRKKPTSTIEMMALWKELELDAEISPDEQERLASLSWSNVKEAKHDSTVSAFERLANAYNQRARRVLMECTETRDETATASSSAATSRASLPRLFRVAGEATNAFYMCGALAQVPNEFPMRLQQHPARIDDRDGDDTSATLDFKPSLTRCVVLQMGSLTSNSDDAFNGTAVTKLQLEPKTGRRHQLRIHVSEIAGHGIVGDAAYNASNGDDNRRWGGTKSSYKGRMCLHAHQLTLPPLLVDTVSAPDPFPIDPETGVIHVMNSL